MDASCYLTCLWPGLSELWYRGRWSALPAAVAFGVALNALLVARFLYPEWLAPSLVRFACWIGVAIWLVLAFRAAGRLPALLQPRRASETPDRFAEAWQEYLRGRWHEAEAMLAGCLEVDPRDCQSLLLLAGVYRHTERFEAAAETLRQLSRLETADAWWLERQAEEKRLARHQQPRGDDASGEADETEETAELAESAASGSPANASPPEPEERME